MRLLVLFILLSFGVLSQDVTTYLVNFKSKLSVYILQIREGSYEVVEFSKSSGLAINLVDSGTCVIKDNFIFKCIKFESFKKFTIRNLKFNKTYWVYGDKLYEKFLDPYLDRDYRCIISNDTNYRVKYVSTPHRGEVNVKKEYTKSFYLKNINKYSPTYLPLVRSSYCGPGCYFRSINNKDVDFSEDTSYLTLINDYTVMVHETTHHFNVCDGYNWETKLYNQRILIEPGISIVYRHTPTFNSDLFISIVPRDAPKKIFRYVTYVGRGSTTSSNLSGIYGLMDEFSAYRNGTRSSLEAAKTAISLNDVEKIKIFLGQSISEYFAYYEFRLFIAWYLEWGQKNRPVVYKEIMDNKNLRIAFTLLDDGFLEDIKELENIAMKYSSWSYEYNEGEYAQYLKLILKDHEKTLIKFKISDVNNQNYINKKRD